MEYKEHGLSPSSLALFVSCQRKYYHKKIAKHPIDTDVSEDQESLNLGKAFHKVLEKRLHLLSGLTLSETTKLVEEFKLNENNHFLLLAMLGKYKTMHEKAGLTAISCEVIVDTPTFYGIVDVILEDKNGWWVGDMKTAATFSSTLPPTLFRHPQLSLYAHHYKEIAEHVGLDPEKYKGCRYRVTTKSKAIKRPTEEVASYINRVSETIRSIDFILPKEQMSTIEVFEVHQAAAEFIANNKAISALKSFPANYNNCLSYFRPCEFFSRCHGKNFTEFNVGFVE